MIQIKKLTLRNFLSVGQLTQTVNFDNQNLTLILGENLDLGGDGAKNGTGKTSILQGLSYALFGSAINNIKKDNLINRTNGKGMVATVDFSVGDINYRIERGRKPTFLKFYVNDEQVSTEESNDSQGDSRETQDAIERVLCMSSEMFKHIVGLNTYTEPFLALRANDQRIIIEQLLGITLLSEKAETIKELNKQVKDEIQKEEYRIRGIEEANRRINEQIESLKKRQKLWTLKKDEDLSKMISEYEELSKIDIDAELQAHKELSEYVRRKDQYDRYQSILARQQSWLSSKERDLNKLISEHKTLCDMNIEDELAAHKNLSLYVEQRRMREEQLSKISSSKSLLTKEQKNLQKLSDEIKTLKEHKCYACGQDFHDEQHGGVLDKKIVLLKESESTIQELSSLIKSLEDNLVEVIEKPKTHYDTEAEAIKHSAEVDNILKKIESKKLESDPYAEQLQELFISDIGTQPKTHYDTESDAIKHSGRISNLLEQISNKNEESDPYYEQIKEMESDGLQEVSFDEINKLTKLMQHQEFLLDLLTNKKSFVRRRIIEQNLSYLNNRLTHYLDRMGLPHTVVFQNDLSVEITELGRELDFHNLSRGEMNRLILSLSWAFRDVWESLYSPINIMFIDEILDNGTDSIGVENSLGILKEMSRRRQKSIWLVSHKEELVNRVPNVFKVIKSGGFTTYEESDHDE